MGAAAADGARLVNAGAAPRLSVIIVTWNVRDLVLVCVAALRREVRDIPMEIIVVDNASSDGTVAALQRADPAVHVIANRQNVGFPVANNIALHVARGEYVLFLNPDTEVGTEAVQTCMAQLEADPRIGMSGCRLVLEDGRTQLECARRPYFLRHLLLESLYLHMLFPSSRVCGDHLLSYWDHEGDRDVEAISGAFMLARRSAILGIGGMPSEVFMYHEDLALCLRMRRAGWRIRYCGSHRTLHRWRGSSTRSTAALALLEGEAKLRLIHEAQGTAAAAVARVVFAVRCLSRLVAGSIGLLLLSWTALPERYPNVFAWRKHALQLLWAIVPRRVERLMPRAPADGVTAATIAAVGPVRS